MTAYLAMTLYEYGYWGKHVDGVHHAIAECCDIGADRGGFFIVYIGPDEMSVNPFTGMIEFPYDTEAPVMDGIYSASGYYLGKTMAGVIKDIKKGYLLPEDFGLHKHAVDNLMLKEIVDE